MTRPAQLPDEYTIDFSNYLNEIKNSYCWSRDKLDNLAKGDGLVINLKAKDPKASMWALRTAPIIKDYKEHQDSERFNSEMQEAFDDITGKKAIH